MKLLEVNQLTSNSVQVGPMAHFEYVFPAIRGVQAGREYHEPMEIMTVSGRELAWEAPKQLKLARQEEFEPRKARHARKRKKSFHKEDRRYRREREIH